ncbi:MAG: hypothetical protein IJQ33_10680 [Clostridia bacterium]|nr:hypothetical protein [Clostridia bacterium]
MLVLGLMLPGIALADVQSRIIAPEHLETTIKSKTGKTEIIIDAAVEVPGVSKAPVFSVLPMPVPAENVVALADELLGPGFWMGPMEYAPDNYAANSDGTVNQTSDSLLILSLHGQKILSADATKLNGSYHGKQQVSYQDYTHYSSNPQELPFAADDMDDTRALYARRGTEAAECACSYEEAAALARRAAHAVAPGLTEMTGGVAIGRDGKTEGYEFCFYRLLNGIPVTYTASRGIQDMASTSVIHKEPWPFEALRIIVYGDIGIGTVLYESPYQIGETLEEAPPLLSFDQIMQVAETILPLKLAYLEQEGKAVHARVDRITFGYARVDCMDTLYQYKLVPAWDFFGVVEDSSRKEYAFDNYSLLTINAIDGTVIDRNYGY